MLKRRCFYIAAVIATAILLFLYSKAFLLAALIIEIIIPAALYLLLRIDAGSLLLSASAESVGFCGTPTALTFAVGKKRSLFAADSLHLVLSLESKMFGESIERAVTLPLKRGNYTAEFTPDLFGEIRVHFESAVCRDVFGFFERRLDGFNDLSIIVYPTETKLSLVARFNTQSAIDIGINGKSEKGNDPSEVYDLREYAEGDDIRSIHWKISSKLDEVVVKESSDFSHFDTLVFVDAGKFLGQKELNRQLISSAVETAVTISDKLITLGFEHSFGFCSKGRIISEPIYNSDSYIKGITELLRRPLEEQSGSGLPYLLADPNEAFNNILYITAGEYPKRIDELSLGTNVTAVLITDGASAFTAKNNAGHMITVPYSQILEKKPFKVFI